MTLENGYQIGTTTYQEVTRIGLTAKEKKKKTSDTGEYFEAIEASTWANYRLLFVASMRLRKEKGNTVNNQPRYRDSATS